MYLICQYISVEVRVASGWPIQGNLHQLRHHHSDYNDIATKRTTRARSQNANGSNFFSS